MGVLLSSERAPTAAKSGRDTAAVELQRGAVDRTDRLRGGQHTGGAGVVGAGVRGATDGRGGGKPRPQTAANGAVRACDMAGVQQISRWEGMREGKPRLR
eukprot:COSAG01_NODE_6317_length_3739_cov_2.900549_4_plen_99_part_01